MRWFTSHAICFEELEMTGVQICHALCLQVKTTKVKSVDFLTDVVKDLFQCWSDHVTSIVKDRSLTVITDIAELTLLTGWNNLIPVVFMECMKVFLIEFRSWMSDDKLS